MPANLRNARVGAQNRAKVNESLKAAGLRGLDVHELCALTGLNQKSVAFYCRTSDGVVSHGLSCNHLVRWFHPEFAAGAEAYRAELASRPKTVYVRWSAAKMDAAVALVDGSGDVGMTVGDVASALDMNVATCSSMLVAIFKDKRIQRVCRFSQSKRYFGLAVVFEPRVRKSKAKPKELHKKAGPKVGTVRKPRPVLVAATTVAKPAPFASAEPIMPKGLKVTVCPSGTDTRFKPSRVEPFFSALAPGNYLRTGSAIERAYGDKEPA